MHDFHGTFRDLLHAANLRHGTDCFTSPPKEGVLRIFSPLKIRRLRPGLNPRTWVPKASTLPLDHRSRYHIAVNIPYGYIIKQNTINEILSHASNNDLIHLHLNQHVLYLILQQCCQLVATNLQRQFLCSITKFSMEDGIHTENELNLGI